MIVDKLFLVSRTEPKDYPNDYCDHVRTNIWIVRIDTPMKAILRCASERKEDLSSWPLIKADETDAYVRRKGHDRNCEYTSYWATPLDLENDFVEIE